ncbi:MAG: oxidoreductase [Bacteroidetes bacterium]|nr:oxidoreductase [Bacteroidota bacterium]MDA1019571.1 oxidoreductase [Bacteroidota bacterium]|tara:strand:+ start:22751 stop:23431 length:681 start_codon:yes stop_codon:yes gene_type:complete
MRERNEIPCVAGSTGLVGSYIVNNLTELYPKVISLTREKVEYSSNKIQNIVIDYDNLKNENIFQNVNHLYIALGSTRKKAGSAKNFIKVDYDYCLELANNALKNGVKRVSIISSVGSNPDSTLLYPRTKGLTERVLSKLAFDHISIMRPGLILGERKERRIPEKIAIYIFSIIDHFLFGNLKKYKSISANDISKAMIYQLINGEKGLHILEYKELSASAEKFDSIN